MSIYNFEVSKANGTKVSLKDYQGKVVLIVNTASKCGFTPQFEALENLYQKYKDNGLVILGFPCNQFAQQDPESNDKIAEFCKINYGVTFPIFAKGDVRGDTAQPLFKYLVSQKKFKGFDEGHPLTEVLNKVLKENFPEILEGDDIKWNFTKFLVDKAGNVVERFEPTHDIEKIDEQIANLLK